MNGEAMAAVPVIKCCVQQRPDFSILLTTTRVSPLEIIKDLLPTGVICQVAPFDTSVAIDFFLGHWKPNAIILMESELWPNLIIGASGYGIPLALLNARMSIKSFRFWSGLVAFPLISLMLSKFSLISPLSTMQAIHFQLLQASPFIVNFSGDLKYAVGESDVSSGEIRKLEYLQLQLSCSRVWMASSIHRGEEEGELRWLYRLTPIAVIGGSFLPGLTGHNISEPAAAGCAVLTGHYMGHFSRMVLDMQQLNPLSILQVSGELDLKDALSDLLGDAKILNAHREAAKQAFHALSTGVVAKTWNLLKFHIFQHIA